ncbi:MAG: hypothetical protein Q4P33_00510, partial [Flaviflexus sp.]|nr:hypothetical protein [Flaviflexus sp.]
MLGLKRLTAKTGAAVFAAFALLAGGSALPSAVAAPAYGAPTIVDECGTENDTITFPATFSDGTSVEYVEGGAQYPVGTPIAIDDVLRSRITTTGGHFTAVGEKSGYPPVATEVEFTVVHTFNDEPCEAEAPVEETATAPFTHDGKELVSIVVEKDGTTWTVLPGAEYDADAVIVEYNYKDETPAPELTPDPEPTPDPDPTPEPEEPAVELEDGMVCEPGSDFATVDWLVVPATYLGVDVDSMVFENAAGTTFTLTSGSPLEDGAKLFKVTASDGTVLFEGCPNVVAPEEPEEPGECIPGETGALAPWTEVPATFQGKDVYYMSFINPSGTAFEQTPGMALEEGTIVLAIYGTDGELLWEDCVLPEEPTEPE